MVISIRKTIAFLCLLLLPAVALFAQTFRADVSNTKVALSESFQIDFTLEGANGNITPPAFNNFTVVSGPSTSSNYQMINGTVSQSIPYSYILTPQKKGKFTIDG